MTTVKRDLWFCQCGGRLFFVTTAPGLEPRTTPVVVRDTKAVYSALRRNGVEIVSVGILPPEMLGLE